MLYSEQLVAEARAGSEQAFNKLADKWYPVIYNFAYKYFDDEDKAMEATQKTFIAVYQNFTSLQDTSKFKSWIYRIAHNTCHNEHKRTKKKNLFSIFRSNDDDEDVQYIPIVDQHAAANPESAYYMQENAEMVQKALSQINPDQKVVVIMKEFEGMKFTEIAETLQISENTAKARLYYGLQALKKILEKSMEYGKGL
ncbi:MAG: RNA polymerase sigma factor [Raineya sp.]|jgi:RNA polymerase sigma-70 factor (ECF subfamily)|nr:RNA polymerase sigma factor [Raineya sp.]